MNARSYITLSGKNLLNNMYVIKDKVSTARIVSMVKANAYGHGLIGVGTRLDPFTDLFGVRSFEEACTLRKNGITKPILLTQGIRNEHELLKSAAYGFEVVIHTFAQLQLLHSLSLSKPIKCWLKINTGMNRLGFDPQDVDQIYHQLLTCNNVSDIVFMSHLACAEDKNHPLNTQQVDTFLACTKNVSLSLSLCNSTAIFNFPEYHFDYVRPGLALYGHSHLRDISAQSLGLLPVMTFYSTLLCVKTIKKGSFVGYTGRYQCPEDMKVGIIGCGYADGYPVTIQDGAPVLIKDRLCPIVGRISMDMIAVDLREVPTAKIDDKVILWGQDLPFDQLIPYSAQSEYSLLTGMHQRVPSVWID